MSRKGASLPCCPDLDMICANFKIIAHMFLKKQTHHSATIIIKHTAIKSVDMFILLRVGQSLPYCSILKFLHRKLTLICFDLRIFYHFV